jgi:hypothetical protein
MKNLDEGHKSGNCATCLYLEREEGIMGKEKCLRFARFVDHMLNDNSRDCEYWQTAYGFTV